MTTTLPSLRSPRSAPRRPGDPWLAAGLLTLAAGLAVNSVLGPLLLDMVRYPFTETVRNETLGLEAVTLLLVVPWAAAAGLLAGRGHPAAPLLALPPAGYAAYMLVQYVVGPQYPTLQPAVLGHLVLFVLSVLVLARAWAAATSPSADGAASPARRWALVLALLAAFVLSRWLPALAGAFSEQPVPAAPPDLTMYWSILLLDLGLVVPAATATAVGVLRAARWAGAALHGLVGWFALVPPSVTAMSVVKLLRDDPAATPGDTAVLAAMTLVGWAVAAALFRPVLRARPPGSAVSAGRR